MSRPDRMKIAYAALVLAAAVAAVWLMHTFQFPPWAMLLVALAFFIPGRIQGIFWREFFRGRRLLAAGDSAGAAAHFLRFQAQMQQRPWLKHLVWLNGAIYTRNIEVMTLNNLGACYLALGDWTLAGQALEAARTLDPQAPLVYFNLALLNQVQGNAEQARLYMERSSELGFRASNSDQLVTLAGELLARIEGRGAKPSG